MEIVYIVAVQNEISSNSHDTPFETGIFQLAMEKLGEAFIPWKARARARDAGAKFKK